MKAIVVEQDVKGSVLAMTDIPAPEPDPSQVKIRVRTASVNRADLAQRASTHQPAHAGGGPVVVGLDAAGDVVEVGREVIGIRVGDRVMAIVNGGLSEEVVVDAALAVPIPEAWSYAEGAAAILGLMTEHNALRTNGGLQPGEIGAHPRRGLLGGAAVRAAGQVLWCGNYYRYHSDGQGN